MRLPVWTFWVLSALAAVGPANAQTEPDQITVSGGSATHASPDRQWADAFGDVMDAINAARSEVELSSALQGIKGRADLLGIDSIDLLYGMAERRREELDPWSDVVIATNAEGLAAAATERVAGSLSQEDALKAGMQAQTLYLDRIVAWCKASDGCKIEDRRSFAMELSEKMLAEPTFWLGDASP